MESIKISEHFSFAELCATAISTDWLTLNHPSTSATINLCKMSYLVLEPLRSAVKLPLHVTSGFRSDYVNSQVGGVPTSLHTLGRAVDLYVLDESHAELLFNNLCCVAYDYLSEFLYYPKKKYCHCGFDFEKTQRKFLPYQLNSRIR